MPSQHPSPQPLLTLIMRSHAQGFVAGLGTQEDGEPMKLRTSAIVPDKSRLPAIFDVQGE